MSRGRPRNPPDKPPRSRGGSESAKRLGRIGTVLYFSEDEREELLTACPLADVHSLAEFGRKAMLDLARKLNRKNSRNT